MDDFNFFLKLAKPLVLNLPGAKDRTMAALWLKKLCDANSHESEPESDNIHVEYLKLLLFVMQGDRLTGIFEEPPPEGSLHDILQPGQQKATDMIFLVKRRRTSAAESQSIPNSHPRVATSIGGDMCEYVAVQEIPNFGIHGYYALSTEPLPKWQSPGSSTVPEGQTSSPSYLKNNFDSAGNKERDSMNDPEAENSEDTRGKTENGSAVGTEPAGADPSDKEFSEETRERPRHSEKSLRKIFQAQRSEVAGVETRPCWGRSRYIERLIDESPHLVGDLDLSEADALLHLYRDKNLTKITKSGRNGTKDSACAISSRRRQVEARLDMPPCASVPVEEDFIRDSAETESRTCLPPKIDSGRMDEVGRGNYDRCCLSENEGYYPTDPIESVGSISLRGGSDDTGLAGSACCRGRRDHRDSLRRNQPTKNTASSPNDSTTFNSRLETREGMNVDREIAEATGLASGKISFDAAKAGNFAWVKKDMCRFLNDHRKMTSTNFGGNAGRRDRSERCYNDTPDSRSRGFYDEGCQRRAEQDYGGESDRWASGSRAQPSHAMSQKTILRSKAASPENPGVNEKTQYWKEMLDFEDTMEDPSMPESYDTSCCGCRDHQYDSEILVETPAYNWRDFAYDSEGEMDEDPTLAENQHSRTSRPMISSNESNALRDEVHRLITDPVRRGPPSAGRIKVPRKNPPPVVGQKNVKDGTWDPPGHSTTIGH